MFPLDTVYGPRAYRTFLERGGQRGESLKSTRQSSLSILEDPPLIARSYTELIEMVSFFGVMNKRETLYFRGQVGDFPPCPAIFRSRWRSLSGMTHIMPKDKERLQRVFDHLECNISKLVRDVCSKFPMPRPATLKMFREAAWAIAQHYELWPTPLIDITPNLRAAASFALWEKEKNECKEGNVFVVALPPSTNSITFEADQHVVLARLQAVCPPVAKRPHYQDGFLVGRFPFTGPNPNVIDQHPDEVSHLSRRLVARIVLKDDDSTFWNADFPRMSASSLMPQVGDDPLLEKFRQCCGQIDDAMEEICRGKARSTSPRAVLSAAG
jgi:hypothetical protein